MASNRVYERNSLQDWKGRQVVVLGLARQGKALSQYLSGQGAYVIVSDRKPAEELVAVREELADWPIEYVLGDHPMNILENTSQMFISGGVPLGIPIVQQALGLGIPISNDSQLFMDLCPAPVIGITGSAGKSTTTALVGKIANLEAEAHGGKAWVGGNIGRPLLLDLEDIGSHDWVILELSSFQLELMDTSPFIAALLNISPNHLDRHKTMEAYVAAKKTIFINQSESDIAIIGREDLDAWDLGRDVKGRLLTFGLREEGAAEGTFMRGEQVYLRINSSEHALFEVDRIPLLGQHNLENVLAASAIAAAAGFSQEAIVVGVESFEGLAHRLEFVREVNGASWYNDSIATSPDRSIAAMNSFDGPIVLLAGGRDKDLPWEEFCEVVAEKVDHLVLFGEAAEKIGKFIVEKGLARLLSIDFCSGLEDAVEKAAQIAQTGDVVLLAPGGTSFDEFADFAARGERFRQLVEEL